MTTSRLVLIAFGGLAAASAVFVIGAVVFQTPPSVCGNEIVAEFPSPDATQKLVVFERDCGATSGFSTQVSLVASNTALPNEVGNVFVADTDHGAARSGPVGGPVINISWESGQSVLLTYDPKARVMMNAREVGHVHIRYGVNT
jgi:hypothetical protein